MVAVDVKAGHVSRETVRRDIDDAASFPDAEIPENPVEDLFHINPAGDPAQRPGGEAKVLGYEFRRGGSIAKRHSHNPSPATVFDYSCALAQRD